MCKHWFSSQRRPDKLHKVIFDKYFYRKQTLSQLSNEYKRSITWVRKQIFEYEPPFNTYIPREVLLQMLRSLVEEEISLEYLSSKIF